jgi:DNA-binding GntR family transcriptional regulator
MDDAELLSATNASEAAEATIAEAVKVLEADILFGRLRPRERLVEDQLTARFGVSRYTVRSALTELERLGIVVRLPHRGAFVRDFSAREVEEIYEIRSLLQARAAARMILPGSAELIEMLTKVQQRHDAAITAKDMREIDQANDAFHRHMFAACGNDHLAEAIDHYAYLTRAMRLYPFADPAVLELLRGEHWDMIRAIESADRVALVDLVVRHLQPSKKAYLAVRATIPY